NSPPAPAAWLSRRRPGTAFPMAQFYPLPRQWGNDAEIPLPSAASLEDRLPEGDHLRIQVTLADRLWSWLSGRAQ
ncbi:MAG: hypothetical protein ABSG53_20420, partial [Thermoguttaceae bacterium]